MIMPPCQPRPEREKEELAMLCSFDSRAKGGAEGDKLYAFGEIGGKPPLWFKRFVFVGEGDGLRGDKP